MATASFEDAATGWEIFRDRHGIVTRSQLNQALRARGRNPIAERTYNHYRKLLRLGYSEYVSINRLDVRHANDSVFDIADRSRYIDRDIASPGRLVIPELRTVTVLDGTVGRVSEGFAVLRVSRSHDAVRVAKATKYDRGVLVFDQVGIERPVRVLEAIERQEALDLVLEFRSLLETDLLLSSLPFAQSSSTLTLHLGVDASLYRVLGALHTSFDLFESVRSLVDVVIAAGAGDLNSVTPAPRVRQLQFSNPLEIVIVGAVTVAGGVGFVIQRVARMVTDITGAVAAVQDLRHASSAEDRAEERHRAEMKALQLDHLKKSIEIDAMLGAVRPGVADALGRDIPELEADPTERASALKDQAVEAAAELALGTDEPVEFSTGEAMSED